MLVPENDVCVAGDVLASVLFDGPVRPRGRAPASLTVRGEGGQVPRGHFKHVVDAVSAHRHRHLRTRLNSQGAKSE